MSIMLKLSNYVTWWDFSGGRYLFCTSSGTLAKVNKNTEQMLKSAKNICDISDESLHSFLLEKGILVPACRDEFGTYRYMTMVEQYNLTPKRRSFTIAVTELCNYNCWYCFEAKTMSGRSMDFETAENVAHYIESIIRKESSSLKELHITWFGGEPIMAIETIAYISNRVIAICNDVGIRYTASVISNGSLITAETMRTLKELRISFLQITIDGDIDTSCLYKGSSHHLFNNSLNSIIYAANDMRVHVRLNTDGTNISSILNVVDKVCNMAKNLGTLENIRFYLACIDQPGTSQFPSWFVETHEVFLSFLEQRGMKHDIEMALPKARFASCGATTDSLFFIGVDGSIVKCEHYLGDTLKAVGHVREGLWHNSEEAAFRDISYSENCKDCSFYPICRQGCLAKRINEDAGVDCTQFKKNIYYILKHLIGANK